MLDKENRKEIVLQYIKEVFGQEDRDIVDLINSKTGIPKSTIYGWFAKRSEVPLEHIYLMSAIFCFVNMEEILKRISENEHG